MSESESSGDNFMPLLCGIGLGALIGAMAALLLAPQAGVQTRTQIKESADDVLTKLRDSVEELRSKVDEMVANTRQALSRRGDTTGELPSPSPESPAGA